MRIAVITKAPFPDGTAPSTYILNVCRVMERCGHHVTVLGCRRGHMTDHPVEGVFDGIEYINFDSVRRGKMLTYLYDNFFERYAIEMLRRLGNQDIVFLYGGTVTVASVLKRYCERKNMKFGAFECEWFTKDSFSSQVSQKHITDIVNLIPYAAKNADVAILISSYLTKYFLSCNVPSIMIPNIVDLADEKWNVRKSAAACDKLKIAYAGIPGVGKDELGTVIKAIELLPENFKEKVELHVYGPDEEKMKFYLNLQGVEAVPSNVICHGKQKQDQIPERLNECHYTILIRKPGQRANAGFSTKMVESFAAGIPFIANITGDIATYLKDEENGIVVADESVEACRAALIRAWELLDKNSEMRVAAYKTAQDNFDYRIYVDAMKDFLSGIRGNE